MDLRERSEQIKSSKKTIREKYSHGTADFPCGVHKTIIEVKNRPPDALPYTVLYAHWHEEMEFFYLKSGSCVFCIAGEKFRMNAGDAAFILPRMDHWAYSPDPDGCTFYSAVFNPSLMISSVDDIINKRYIMPVLRGQRVIGPLISPSEPWSQSVIADLISLFSCYDEEPYDKVRDNLIVPELNIKESMDSPELKIKALILNIWSECFIGSYEKASGLRISDNNYERISRAIDYIHQNYSESFTLEELASSVYMSREHFSHVFKAYLNISPFVYLNKYRIQKSLWHLENTDMKITDVATLCGFNHVSYYNRTFFKYMKCSPTDYRRGSYRDAKTLSDVDAEQSD